MIHLMGCGGKLTSATPRWKRSAVKGTLIGVRLQPELLAAAYKAMNLRDEDS